MASGVTLNFFFLLIQKRIQSVIPNSVSFSSSVLVHEYVMRVAAHAKLCGCLECLHFTFTFMHLADAFIQSDLHCIQVTVFFFTFYQLLLSLGIEPMILVLLAPCFTIWATGKLYRMLVQLLEEVQPLTFELCGVPLWKPPSCSRGW